jgi:hypothetical protein
VKKSPSSSPFSVECDTRMTKPTTFVEQHTNDKGLGMMAPEEEEHIQKHLVRDWGKA